jgi:hypothetical protein
MEVKTFKKALSVLLISKGFKKNGAYYSLHLPDIIIVIGLQKSNYSNSYYINIGYLIIQLNPVLKNPRDVDGDIRSRFGFEKNGETIDSLNLDEFNDEDALKENIERNLKEYIEPVTSLESLRSLLRSKPVMLYQTKLSAKKLLGFT